MFCMYSATSWTLQSGKERLGLTNEMLQPRQYLSSAWKSTTLLANVWLAKWFQFDLMYNAKKLMVWLCLVGLMLHDCFRKFLSLNYGTSVHKCIFNDTPLIFMPPCPPQLLFCLSNIVLIVTTKQCILDRNWIFNVWLVKHSTRKGLHNFYFVRLYRIFYSMYILSKLQKLALADCPF